MKTRTAKDRAGGGGQKKPQFRRVNLTIREDQFQLIHSKGLSLSALVRDMLDDRFSSNKIVLNLTDHGKELYDTIVGSMGVPDVDLEPFFLIALDGFLEKKMQQLTDLRNKVKK